MVRDYRGRELEPGIAAEIVENDKTDISGAGAMIANCPKPSVCTSMEVLFAHDLGIPVVVVHPADLPPSPWIIYHADAIVHSMADAVAAIGAPA